MSIALVNQPPMISPNGTHTTTPSLNVKQFQVELW